MISRARANVSIGIKLTSSDDFDNRPLKILGLSDIGIFSTLHEILAAIADKNYHDTMEPHELLQRIWEENELAILARSRSLYDEIARVVKTGRPEQAFVSLARASRQPLTNWHNAVLHLWSMIQETYPNDFEVLDRMLAATPRQDEQHRHRTEVQLWLWRRVVRSGKPPLARSRLFADQYLFHRVLVEDRLVLWYGGRQAEWPVQLLLGLFLGSNEKTKRLRQVLSWPIAKLPDGFQASRYENRTLRRLWEARILVRFGTWAHLHPHIMLHLPEVSSFSSPVLKWQQDRLVAFMADGRVWPIASFALAALVFDEAVALFGRDRQRLWKNFLSYGTGLLQRPDDTASNFVQNFFAEIGLRAMATAPEKFLVAFAQDLEFLESLRQKI